MNICKDCRIPAAVAAVAVFMAGCGKTAPSTAPDSSEPAKAEAVSEAEPVVESAASEPVDAKALEMAAAPSPFADFKDDTVLVEVAGEKLTYGEALGNIKKMLQSRGAPAEQVDILCNQFAPQAIPQMAEQFVMLNVLKAEAKAKNYSATDADVDEMIAKMVKQLPPGMTLSNALAMSGMTEEAMRKEMLEALPINKMLEKLTETVSVEEKEIADFYEKNAEQFTTEPKVRASHILIKVDEDAKDEEKAAAKAKLEAIRKQILAGADFAELAATNSACPSKEQGGDLGFFGKGQMVPAFEKAAFALPTNVVSDVVETRFGYHLIKVTDRKEGGKTPLAEVSADIKQHLENTKKAEIVEDFAQGLRAKSTIVVAPGLELFAEEAAPAAKAEPAPAAKAEPAPAAKAEPAPAAKAEPAPAAK